MKERIPDQAEKLRQLAAGQDPAAGVESVSAVIEPKSEGASEAPLPAGAPLPRPKEDGKQKPKTVAPSTATQTPSDPTTAAPKNDEPKASGPVKNKSIEATAKAPKPATPANESSKEQLNAVVTEAGSAKEDSTITFIGPPPPPEPTPQAKPEPMGQPTLMIDPAKRFPMQSKTKVIAITGGKGGVGKSNLTCNLAIAMQRMKKRVIIMDADLSLANIDVLLGLAPRHNLSHVLSGKKSIQEIMLRGPEGLGVIPGGSGVEELSQLSDQQIGRLFDAFASLTPEPDVFLIDTAAGIHPNVLQFLLAADQAIVVTTPEPPAYTDAYALIKTLRRHQSESELGVVVNMANDGREANEVARLMSQICTQMLKSSFNNLGFIPRDPEVLQAVRRQTPFLIRSPNCPASRAVVNLAASLLQIKPRDKGERGLRRFFKRLFQRAEPPPKTAVAS